jgi:hypothetical protein
VRPFLASVGWLLRYAHLAGALGLVGATAWQAWLVALRADGARLARAARRAAALYGLVFALGLLLYPLYRVQIRFAFFDRPGAGLGWLARLFDIKEHVAALGLPAVLGCALIARRTDGTARDGAARDGAARDGAARDGAARPILALLAAFALAAASLAAGIGFVTAFTKGIR